MYLGSWKCAFGVILVNLPGYVVSPSRMEVNPSKIKAIQELPPPRIGKEMGGFLGHLQYSNRFISKSVMVLKPIFKKLKKGVKPEWHQ